MVKVNYLDEVMINCGRMMHMRSVCVDKYELACHVLTVHLLKWIGGQVHIAEENCKGLANKFTRKLS
jgi:hypothetical protein